MYSLFKVWFFSNCRKDIRFNVELDIRGFILRFKYGFFGLYLISDEILKYFKIF